MSTNNGFKIYCLCYFSVLHTIDSYHYVKIRSLIKEFTCRMGFKWLFNVGRLCHFNLFFLNEGKRSLLHHKLSLLFHNNLWQSFKNKDNSSQLYFEHSYYKILPGQYLDCHTFLIKLAFVEHNETDIIKILSSYIGGRNGDKLESSIK